MTILINNLQDSNHKVVLMGDFNESIYSGRRKDLADLTTTCGLVDPCYTICPDTPTLLHFFEDPTGSIIY